MSASIKFGYTIIYVPKVSESLAFFEKAFGFKARFLHDSGDYGELDTGDTTLAFASHTLGSGHFPQGYVEASASRKPLGMEVAFVCADHTQAHAKALTAGASELNPLELKPWGQSVSYVRCPDGTLVELCSPIGN
jgi:lactoylglutathione lyase